MERQEQQLALLTNLRICQALTSSLLLNELPESADFFQLEISLSCSSAITHQVAIAPDSESRLRRTCWIQIHLSHNSSCEADSQLHIWVTELFAPVQLFSSKRTRQEIGEKSLTLETKFH